MSLLMGFLALAVDVGTLFRVRRNMQIAADAAATAGALDYKYNGVDSSAVSAGQTAAVANGVTNVSYATIHTTPTSGYHQSHGYIEAIINQPSPTFFMRLFGINSIDVYARAVAGSGANSGCIWTLAKSGADVTLTGSGSITAQNCNIYDDSNAGDALTLTGSGSISAKQIGIAGGYSRTGSGRISPNPPTTGMAPASDPLNLTAPTLSPGTCTGGNCNPANTGSSPMTLNPGTYASITNTGSGTLTLNPGNYIITGNLTNTGSGKLVLGAGNYTIGGSFLSTGSSSLTLGTGLYAIGGSLSLTGSGPLTGNGVTFYTKGSMAVTGSGNMNLTAPTSGTYSGVLFYQPSGNAVALTGSAGANIQGIVYAPKSALTLTGSGSMTVSLDIVVDSLSVTGSGSITDTNYAVVTNPNSVLGKLVMVE
jgi:Putative Flp pilus-assembly TadE/G-like